MARQRHDAVADRHPRPSPHPRLHGESLEDVVVHAFDAYEAAQFWARAEAWAAAETPTERAERKLSEAEWDTLMDRLK